MHHYEGNKLYSLFVRKSEIYANVRLDFSVILKSPCIPRIGESITHYGAAEFGWGFSAEVSRVDYHFYDDKDQEIKIKLKTLQEEDSVCTSEDLLSAESCDLVIAYHLDDWDNDKGTVIFRKNRRSIVGIDGEGEEIAAVEFNAEAFDETFVK